MMKRYSFFLNTFFFICFMGISLNGQELGDRDTYKLPATYFKTKNAHLSIQDILASDQHWFSDKPWNLTDLNASYWIRLDFADRLHIFDSIEKWQLRTSNFSKANLYIQKGGEVSKIPFGKFNREQTKSSLIYYPGVSFNKENLLSGKYLFLEVQMSFPIKGEPEFAILPSTSNRFFTEYYNKQDIDHIIADQIYLGACLVLFLMFLIIYFNIKKPEFLFYSLYILCSAIFLVQENINISGYQDFFDSLSGYWLVVISQIFINFFYLIFIIHYLNTRKNYPKLDTIIRIMAGILVIIVLSDMVVYSLGRFNIHYSLLNFQRLVMSIFGIISMIYLLVKAKDKLAHIVVVGSFIYMLGALLYLFTGNKYYMLIGSSTEIIVFSLGIAYKIKLEFRDKLALERQLSLKELSFLRAQMNPHFIFNALNSIQHLIIKNEKRSALKYLSNFGRLTRNVLESSHSSTVSLAEEIRLLKSYLELESLRFDGAFKYSIIVDNGLDPDDIDIPLMLIQPFVENAIVHGLLHKKSGEKKLFIRFKKEGNLHICEVEDNGIGREAANKVRSILKRKDRPRGLEITTKRLEMHASTNFDKRNSVEIVDKYDSMGNPSGTKVIIRINKILKESA